MSGEIWASFSSAGIIDVDKDKLIIKVIVGSTASWYSFNSQVGIGSWPQDFVADCFINFLTSPKTALKDESLDTLCFSVSSRDARDRGVLRSSPEKNIQFWGKNVQFYGIKVSGQNKIPCNFVDVEL